jgi:hypothetical protein
MKSRKLLGVTALFYTDKKYLREWDRLWGLHHNPLAKIFFIRPQLVHLGS